MLACLPRAVHMAKCTPQRLDFPFVGVLLPLGNLERFQDFLHVIQGFAQGLDDSIDLIDGLLNRLG